MVRNMIIDTDKWGEFTISKLFDIHPTKAYKLTNKDLLEDDGKNPVIVNSGFNNGVGGYTNRDCTEEKGIITFTDTAAKSTDSFFIKQMILLDILMYKVCTHLIMNGQRMKAYFLYL